MNNKRRRLIGTIGIVTILVILGGIVCFWIKNKNSGMPLDKYERISHIIKDGMQKGNIPGLAVSINDSEGERTYMYGYSDKKNEVLVNQDTLFQLGSNSKAFTGLAICVLAEQGSIDLNDSIFTYIPDLSIRYDGEIVDVTIEQLLHQTSGISEDTIVEIPEDDSENALEKCVYQELDQELDQIPGKEFKYASLNYDVLGLVIEKVTGMPYEKYMSKYIFEMLGLNHTYASTNQETALGYKYGMMGVSEYLAPVYKGNLPAGYILSDISDMSRWLAIQMGKIEVDDRMQTAITQSHTANLKNGTNVSQSYYATGWYVQETIDGTQIFHAGNNPNFSSYMIYNRELDTGICIMANMNSPFVSDIAMRIFYEYQNDNYSSKVEDSMKMVNVLSVCIGGISVILLFAILYLIMKKVKDIFQSKNNTLRKKADKLKHVIIVGIITAMFCFGIYKLPSLIYDNADWKFARVWLPKTVVPTAVLFGSTLVVFLIYYVLTLVFESNSKIQLMHILVIGILSGLGNSLVIFVINTAVSRNYEFDKNLFVFFLIGLFLYILGQRIVRYDLVDYTTEIVYTKRKRLIQKLLNCSYDEFEKIESGQIQACINNDTEIISNFANVIISGATCVVVVLCCFCYLFVVNKEGFLITCLVVLIAVVLYYIITEKANKFMQEARDCQNVFFKHIMDMLLGFKELSINTNRKNEFMNDTFETCRKYRNKQQESGENFSKVNIIGESLFTTVIGIIVFLFPLVLQDSTSVSLRNYVFVLLYITGPINSILHSIPSVFQYQISWRRIQELEDKLITNINQPDLRQVAKNIEEFERLSVNQMVYKYNQVDGFEIGPINAEFRRGQITFIVGGNGSGKSTLIKLLTSLYTPSSGAILLNGRNISREELGEMFTTVYSDFYLFSKIYGHTIENKLEEVDYYLDILGIKDKVTITKEECTTTSLSTGQKKRLALFLSYIEDKPVFVFDEWAADQDPGFREYFYRELLPQLREKGKCVIAITHDDRYFKLADQVINMELGKVVS